GGRGFFGDNSEREGTREADQRVGQKTTQKTPEGGGVMDCKAMCKLRRAVAPMTTCSFLFSSTPPNIRPCQGVRDDRKSTTVFFTNCKTNQSSTSNNCTKRAGVAPSGSVAIADTSTYCLS
ncbi:unnamed protein product, partial [Ectocarpus sp. 4 AP-2014]